MTQGWTEKPSRERKGSPRPRGHVMGFTEGHNVLSVPVCFSRLLSRLSHNKGSKYLFWVVPKGSSWEGTYSIRLGSW